MSESVLLFILSQAVVLLFFSCLALVLLRRRQKKIQANLEEKIISLRGVLAQTKENAKALINQAKSEAVSATANTQAEDMPELVADLPTSVEKPVAEEPVVEDINTEIEDPLVTESAKAEDASFTDENTQPDEIIQATPVELSKEDQDQVLILQEELANQKKRIQTLEQFKTLCFEIDSEWHQSNRLAIEQIEVLKASLTDDDAKQSLDGCLKHYAPVEALLTGVQTLAKGELGAEPMRVEAQAADDEVADPKPELEVIDSEQEETASNDDVDDLLAEMGVAPEPEADDPEPQETTPKDDVDDLLAEMGVAPEPKTESEPEKQHDPMSSDDVDDLLAELDHLTESALEPKESKE